MRKKGEFTKVVRRIQGTARPPEVSGLLPPKPEAQKDPFLCLAVCALNSDVVVHLDTRCSCLCGSLDVGPHLLTFHRPV